MLRRYLPVALDLSLRELLAALAAFRPGPIPPAWPGGAAERSVTALSVRSAFDLLLQSWEGEPGEILVGAITHPDMVAILRHHGWDPLPIDLDPETLLPDPGLLERSLGPRTRAVLVTHLFGGRLDLSRLAPWCRERGLVLLEDCAQAFVDLEYRGHPQALASFFSFGPIKTATALGGAVAWVRDPALQARMERRLAEYSEQSGTDFLGRVLKYGLVHLLSQPPVCAAVHALLSRLGYSLMDLMRRGLAGFPGPFRLERFRRRPHPALLRLLARRLRRHRRAAVERRGCHGEAVGAAMPAVARPGSAQLERTWWIYPVTLERPETARQALAEAGFDAMPGLSNLVCLEAPPDRPELEPARARYVVEHSLLVPVRPGLAADQARLTALLGRP